MADHPFDEVLDPLVDDVVRLMDEEGLSLPAAVLRAVEEEERQQVLDTRNALVVKCIHKRIGPEPCPRCQ